MPKFRIRFALFILVLTTLSATGAANFYGNVATLPLDSSSTFIRSRSGGIGGVSRPPNELASIQDTLAAFKDVESGIIRMYLVSLCSWGMFPAGPFAETELFRQPFT